MILTYKYRLRPTKKQSCILSDILFQMQTVYNDALNERRWHWSRSRRLISFFEQSKRMTQEKKRNLSEMNLLNVTSTWQMLRRLDKSYRAFYKGQRGIPRFKGGGRFKSVEYRHGDGCKIKGDRLYIQHVGDVKIRLHRLLPADAEVKHVILKRSREKWDVCFQVEIPDAEAQVHVGLAVGVDVGLMRLATLSDGNWVDNPRWLRSALAKKRILNRKLSRQKRNGTGWCKTVDRIAKLDAHIANQRRDFWHKVTHRLSNTYSTIVIEDLNLAFMTRNRNLSLSAHDAALGMFRQILTYKVEKTGTRLIAVDPRNTSQECADCGAIVKKPLSIRTHNCTDCGLRIDRDINAALNILSKGGACTLDRLTYADGQRVLSEAPLF